MRQCIVCQKFIVSKGLYCVDHRDEQTYTRNKGYREAKARGDHVLKIEIKDVDVGEFEIQKAYFNLTAELIRQCFNHKPLHYNENVHNFEFNQVKTKKRRREFAHSQIVKLFADCSENFEHERLKKEIIKFNS